MDYQLIEDIVSDEDESERPGAPLAGFQGGFPPPPDDSPDAREMPGLGIRTAITDKDILKSLIGEN